MKSDLPPLNWVKTFEAAARLLNFSAAARELHMTQSAVSQHIKLLENHLGDELFVRNHRKVSLTNSGLAYLPVVQSLLTNLQRKTSDIFSPVGKGRLVIVVNYAFSSLWLSHNLYKFCARYPGIGLQIIHANWDTDFFDGAHDIAIINGHGDWPGLSLDPLIRTQVKPYCSGKNAKLITQPKDLCSLPLIEVVGTHHSWVGWFEEAGVSLEGVELSYHKVDTLLSAALMAESGLGAMLGYPNLLRTQFFKQELIAPIDIELGTQDNYFLASPQGKPLSKSATVFRKWLLEEMSNLVTT